MKHFLKIISLQLCLVFLLTACATSLKNTNNDDEKQYSTTDFNENEGEYNPDSQINLNNSSGFSNGSNNNATIGSNNTSRGGNKNNKEDNKGPNKNKLDNNAYYGDDEAYNPSDDDSTNTPIKDDGFVPVLRFAVTGDIHTRNNNSDFLSHQRLAAVYDTAYSYADKHKSYNKLDGIFFTGDNSQNGSEEQQKYFFNYLKQNTKKGTVTRAVMGNHEYYQTGYVEEGARRFREYSGYDSTDAHITMGGYHFIFISLDKYEKSNYRFLSNTKLNWLKNELDKAVSDTPDKQIFVFTHVPPHNTLLYSATTDGDKQLKTLLNNYSQVVIFSGHTHASISDPRSIWQGQFTALNTGSMAYLSLGIPGTSNSEGGYRALDNEGACEISDSEETIRNGNLYYIVEIDKNGTIKIIIYDIFTNSQYGEPIILDSINPSKFKYTTARKYDAVKPVFNSNASLKVLSTYYKNVIVDIPLASCKYDVQAYRIDVYSGNTRVKSLYRLHGYGDAPTKKVRAYINGLQPSTNYTVKVFAISSYAYESDPLMNDVTTSAANSTLNADILNVEFNSDGTATNLATGDKLDKNGAPTVTLDKSLGLNVASFDGNDAYSFMQLHNWYDEIGNGFTFETYAYISKKPSSGYVDIISGQEGGGFGFEYKSSQQLCFYLYLGSDYQSISTQVNVGTWVHLVAVYDGYSMKLYLNGSLATQKTVSGKFKPQIASAQYFCVGADSAPITPNHHFSGKIAVANIYSDPLTSSQVSNIYKNLTS